MAYVKPRCAKQAMPLILVVTGLIACALAERFGYRDLVTIAVGTNAAGLALLTQHGTQITKRDGGEGNGSPVGE